MKKILWLVLFLVPLCALAYQAGGASRANFSSGAVTADKQAEEKSTSAVPGQKAVQTRSFTSYSARSSNAWRQGVQTTTVQTPTAQAAFKDGGDQAARNAPAALNKQLKPTPQAKQSASPQTDKTAPAASQANTQPPQDPAAMMQQMQGAQDMMKQVQSLQGMMGNNASAGAAAAPTMPAGMPDLSSLMGGSAPAAAPAKK